MRYWSHQTLYQMHERSLQWKSYSLVWNKCNWCCGACRLRNDSYIWTIHAHALDIRDWVSASLSEHKHYLIPARWYDSTYSCAFMNILSEIFPGCLVSWHGDIAWPPRSPDVNASDFFFWAYLKSNVFRTCPTYMQELKTCIHEEMSAIPPHQLLQNV
jgi:hypothetical protein